MKKKKFKYLLFVVISIIVTSAISVYATILFDANEVVYDNTTSGLNSTNVQGAIDELYSVLTDYSVFNSDVTNLKKIFNGECNTSAQSPTFNGNPITINGYDTKDTFYDSGWKLLTNFNSRFSNYGTADTYKMRIRRIGNMVTIHGSFTYIDSSTPMSNSPGCASCSTPQTVMTIPSEYCPKYSSYTMQHGSGNNHYYLAVKSDCTVRVSRVTQYATSANGGYNMRDVEASDNYWFAVDVTYMLN